MTLDDAKMEQVVISVKDNRPGIEQKDLVRLFAPFERVQSAQKPAEKSSGLGLAIVKKIVEAHGGKTWVESKLGEGAIFYVSLPLNHPLEAQKGNQ